MRIAIVRQKYTPFGGAERFVAQALRALAAEGVGLSLFTRQWPKSAGLDEVEPIICNPFYLGSVWRDWSFERSVAAAQAQRPPMLVQSHERIACCDLFRAGDGVHAVWLAERRRQLGWRGRLQIALNPYHVYTLAAERRMFNSPRLRAVICNSQLVRDEIATLFPKTSDRLHVIYNAVDPAVFHPGLRSHRAALRDELRLPAASTVLLHVGSGFERKGVATTLRALAMLPPANRPHFVVVGKDKHQPRYQRLAEELGIAAQVRFTGPRQDVKPYYGMADVFVLPTLYDPCPNAALEALSCGLPVVTSRKCGAAELVTAHQSGLVGDALDVPALAHHLATLADAGSRAAMASRATATVRQLTPERMTAQLLALYRQLLAHNC